VILEIAVELFSWDSGYVHLYSEREDKIIPVLTVDTIEGDRVTVQPASFTLEPSPLMRLVMKGGARLINREGNTVPELNLIAFGDKNRLSASMMYVPIRFGGESFGASFHSELPAPSVF